ncbi:MAG: (d)CMP kinase [candidate division KSB1 bacterium]|nr:(d)CMP kinase [candidate division KSB1 bacterium]MDZ7378705.1 (d)CMP kinase [candidate division KSB1 bacterium]MDZ7393524.1 (d)CMP kinase [candidate division KSB1 bacterium]MDZ7413381.1 (d)CMP kinase [candidate division KSB1 bacterium]
MAQQKRLIIAIDGVAASGKSTTARLVAQRLGYLYLDSGALYRALTLKVLRKGIDPAAQGTVAEIARQTQVDLRTEGGELRVFLDGEDVTEEIRGPEVSEHIGPVAANGAVRQRMVELQRALAAGGGVVAEGRDIGTVVFPDADVKFYFTASLEVRAQRRQAEYAARSIDTSVRQLAAQLERRDRDDRARTYGPLRKAPDAIEVDTSHMTIEEQVEFVLQKVRERLSG